MSDSRENLVKQEEDCIKRYKADLEQIYQRQDDAKWHRRFLESADEQIRFDTKQVYDQLESYSNTRDLRLLQTMISCQNQVCSIQAESERFFTQELEDLSLVQKKLENELDDREREYNRELSRLKESARQHR